jgi:hypothetical protein
MKEQLDLTEQEARNIVWEDDENFNIVYDRQTGTSRWSIIHEVVVQRLSDGKFFKSTYRTGATECQDERPYENTLPIFTEVEPVERTIIVYE